jgi:sugar lactone lactonase YvrE
MNKYIFLLAVTILLGPSMAHAQFVTTPPVVGADLRFGRLGGLAIDSTGTFVVSDVDGGKIVRLSPSLKPIKTTLFSTDGSYDMQNPGVPLVRSTGELLVPDFGSDKVFRFDSLGNYIASIDGTVGKMFADPSQVAEDSTGAIYIADSNNHRIVKFSPDGTFEWEVGSLGTAAGQFKHVGGIAVTPSQQVLVSDVLNNRICVYSTNGDFISSIDTSAVNIDVRHPGSIVADVDGTFWVISTATGNVVHLDLAGQVISGIDYRSIVSNGTPDPRSLAISGNELFIADGDDSQIYRFGKDGRYLGKLLQGNDDGSRLDIPSAAAKINAEYVVADSGNHRLAFYALGGEFIRSVGSFGDGVGYFQFPTGLSVSSDGLIAVADSGNHRVQVVRPDASVSLVIPPVGSNYSLSFPSQAVWVQDGTLWIVDQNNSCIRHVDSSGNLLATIGGRGSSDRTFESPTALAIAPNGDIFVSDTYNHRIQRFSSDGSYLATIGSFGAAPSQFNEPKGIVVLDQGLLAVADSGNHRIQVFLLDGTFKAEHGSFGDSTGQYMTPEQLTVVDANRIIVSDSSTNKITLLQIDLSTPSSTILFVPDTGLSWSRESIQVSIASTDVSSGVKEIHYSINMGDEKVAIGATTTFNLTDNGTHVISYFAVDNAGNSETAQLATVKIDKVAPVSTLIRNAGLISLFASDAHSGVSKLKYQVDGGVVADYSVPFLDTVHTVTYWAEDVAGNVETAKTEIVNAGIKTISLSQQSVTGGVGIVGTVTLDKAAPIGGSVISLASSVPSVAVLNPTVTVPEGSTEATFDINVNPIGADMSVSITASIHETSQSALLTVQAPVLSSLLWSTSPVVGGTSTTGTLSISGPAPMGGLVVSLTSNNAAATVPVNVTIDSGQRSVTFTVNTAAVAANVSATVTATLSSGSLSASVGITAPVLSSVSLGLASVVGGTSSDGVVTLSSAAPDGGLMVTLASSSPSASVPITVVVPAGQTVSIFSVSTRAVASNTATTISASFGGVRKSVSLGITAPALSSVTLNPTSVTGGTSSTGTVTLSSAAPSGGLVVTLASSSSFVALPSTVIVPEGATTATFTVNTSPVTSATIVTIVVTSGPVSKSPVLTVNPPAAVVALNSVTVTPTSVVGGASVTGTVTLSGAAPVGGVVVTLTSSSVSARVPVSVTVPAGATSATFPITTIKVNAVANVNVTGNVNAVALKAVLQVTPTCAPVTFVLNPASVKGGSASTGTVTLNGPAPTGGTVVTLKSSKATAATVAASVTVPTGATSVNFIVSSKVVSATTSATITVAAGGVSKSVSLSVTK